jgi:hypothetical protein
VKAGVLTSRAAFFRRENAPIFEIGSSAAGVGDHKHGLDGNCAKRFATVDAGLALTSTGFLVV